LTAIEVNQRLNFVDGAGKFNCGWRNVHLIGEIAGAGYTSAEFAAEAENIINEISQKTKDKLAKQKKK